MVSVVVAILFVNLNFVIGQFNLWPLPQQYTNGSDTVTVCSSNFSFKLNIQSSILDNAMLRFSQYLSAAPTILKTEIITNIISTNEAHICSGIIKIHNTNNTLSLNTNESYSLSIQRSSITISTTKSQTETQSNMIVSRILFSLWIAYRTSSSQMTGPNGQECGLLDDDNPPDACPII